MAINVTVGNNGLIKKAQEAAQKTEEAQAMEEMGIYLTGVKLKEIEEDFRLADYLSNNIGNDGLEDFLNNGDGYGQAVPGAVRYRPAAGACAAAGDADLSAGGGGADRTA